MDKFLSSIYYDPKNSASFGTVRKLYNASKKGGKRYTEESVKNWLKKQDTYTLYKPQRKNFPTRKILTYGLDDVHMADLLDASKHSKYNDGIKFLLVVIDIASKFAWVVPLKSKSNQAMVSAFESLYTPVKSRVPLHLGTDQGTEFTGKTVQAVFQKYNVHHYVLYNRQKAAAAERLIRTLKARLHKYMDSQGSERYIDVLQDIVASYNATIHTTTRVAPKDVNYENVNKVLKRVYAKKQKIAKNPKYSVGDFVRLSAYRKTFEKSYEQSYTDEIFKIVRVLKTLPVTYKLQDYYEKPIIGSFYQEELTGVIVPPNKAYRLEKVIKQKGQGKSRRYLVKYRGYSKPEWVKSVQGLRK